MKHWNSILLEQLLQVQDTDLKIRKLELQVQVHNQRSKEEDTELSRIKSEITRIDETLVNTESQNQMYATTLEDIRAAIKGLLTTKAGVPKPRTRSSTEALKIEEEKLESLVEETAEQLIKLKEDRDLLVIKAETRTEELETHSDGPEAEIRKLQQQIRKLEKQREEEVTGIPQLLLKHYDRLRSSRSGIGLTIIRDGVCTVCCMQMPTAVYSKLSHGEKIDMCPACGRMVARIEMNVPVVDDVSEDSIDRPSRKLRKVKSSKTLAFSRETADERKAALKKTLKKKIAGLDAARSEAEASSRRQASLKKDVKSSTKKKVKIAAAPAVAESTLSEASKKGPVESAVQKTPKSKKLERQEAAVSKAALKAKNGGDEASVSSKAKAKNEVVAKSKEKKPAAKAVKEKPVAAKSASKKSEAPKSASKKADGKKTDPKKVEPKKAAKKSDAKKSIVTKPAAKNSAPKKADGKKTDPKKVEPKKAAKKSDSAKVTAKKPAQKKPAKAASKKK